MLVRTATITDSPQISALHAASWRHAYRSALSDAYLACDVESDRRQLWDSRLENPADNQRILLLEDGHQLLGFACIYVGEDALWGSYLNNIHVLQAAQGQGLGKRLLRACAQACSASQAGGLYLWVLQSNTNAQGFYARYGAKNTGSDIWDAPGGTTAPLFRYSWEDTTLLEEMTGQ